MVKNGVMIHQWGAQDEVGDWLSSAKPVLSTLLLFAIREELVATPDTTLAGFGWNFKPKDRAITFRHLANMMSGYARPEAPGAAWSYNDYAIQLYQLTLFDKVFRGEPEVVAQHPSRLGALGLEDGLRFRPSNRRLSASVRDFARIAWFWLHKGNWNSVPLLPRRLFEENQKAQTPRDLPQTAAMPTDDYLGIGTFGGGSDHFTIYGAGIYGFNWWFNGYGRLHPASLTWPSAPRDTFMSIGFGGNNAVMIPSLGVAMTSARGNWGQLNPGDADSPMNRHLARLVAAVA